jgi:uncharacterized protein
MALPELIDWHTHLYLNEHRLGADEEVMKRRGVAGAGKASPELHLAAMQERDVSQVIVVPSARSERVNIPNEFIANYVKSFPGKAIGFCTVDPRTPGALEEFEKGVKELGLRGLKLSPTYQALDPRSPICWPFYELARDFNIPVMLHCGGAYSGSLEFQDPTLLDKVAMAFPDLRIWIAHLGQPFMEQTVILMRKNENIWADLSARFHRKWQLYNGLMHAIEYGVTDRLLFGSDFPIRSPKVAEEEFKNINDWGENVTLPRIPTSLIDDILYNRPLSLMNY